MSPFLIQAFILTATISMCYGSFYLRTSGSGGKCANAYQGGLNNGDLAVIWDCMNFATNEFFDNIPVNSIYNLPEENYFQLKVKSSGKCLDVFGGESATGNGVKVVEWDCIPTDKAMMFTYVPSKLRPGYFMIKARHSGRCLNVYNSGTANGVQIVQWDCVDAANDNWEVLNCVVPYSSTDTKAFDAYLKLMFRP